MQITMIDEQFVRGGQKVSLMLVEEWQDFDNAQGSTVLFSIVSDAYQMQSHAKISLWDGDQWRRLHSIICYAMQTPAGLYGGQSEDFDNVRKRDECRKLFEEDVLRLREVGKKILFGKDTK